MLAELRMNGWRKRIGYISPSILETTAHDFFRFAPTGVGLVGITSNIETWGKDHFEKALARLVEDANSLATRKVDYIIYAGVPLLVARGKGADLELISSIRRTTGLESTTSIRAALEAMDWFGVRRIALATPYPAETQRNTVNFLRAHDIEIVKEASMDVGFRVLQDVHPHQIYQFGRQVFEFSARGRSALHSVSAVASAGNRGVAGARPRRAGHRRRSCRFLGCVPLGRNSRSDRGRWPADAFAERGATGAEREQASPSVLMPDTLGLGARWRLLGQIRPSAWLRVNAEAAALICFATANEAGSGHVAGIADERLA